MGADCGICEKPLQLLWTIDCTDSRFEVVAPSLHGSRSDSLARFRKIGQLPILYCWRCVTDISYRVVSARDVVVVREDGEFQGKDWPYVAYPEAFPETSIELEEVPRDVEWLLQIADRERGYLSDVETVRLNQFLGSDGPFDLGVPWMRRLGGLPVLIQGHENLTCKYSACALYSADDDPWLESSRFVSWRCSMNRGPCQCSPRRATKRRLKSSSTFVVRATR